MRLLNSSMIRSPAVAGSFYPENPVELRQAIGSYLVRATASSRNPRAIVVPHAGYVYSGAVAAAAYKGLEAAAEKPERVVLLGPSHRVPLTGMGFSTADAWATPLGEVPLDHGFIETLLKFPGLEANDEAHAPEHSLEVQLPFLQAVLGNFLLVPLVVGRAESGDVAALLQGIPDDGKSLIVISTDLSHYLSYEKARETDAKTAASISSMQSRGINDKKACGVYPLRGFLDFARDNNLKAKPLALKNSGDTAGGKSEVVGYGAWAFENS
jgi:AmmeMemoRadiSam system protein B